MNLVYEVVEFSAFESKIQKVNLINNQNSINKMKFCRFGSQLAND